MTVIITSAERGKDERCLSMTTGIDDAVLALLYLGLHQGYRAWKGFDWDAMGRLYEKGMIDNPRSKAKSVAFSEEGLRRAKELSQAMFVKKT
jgi:hypothetical protein